MFNCDLYVYIFDLSRLINDSEWPKLPLPAEEVIFLVQSAEVFVNVW